MSRPRVNSEAQKSLDTAQEQFNAFNNQVQSLNPFEVKAPVEEKERQTRLSNGELKKMDAPYIHWTKLVNRPNTTKTPSYWDEKYRAMHDKDWEYIKVTVENNEIIGEDIEMWTAEYGCDPAHFWKIPTNKPVYVPRLVARKIASCRYHRLVMEDRPTQSTGGMQFYGAMAVSQTKQRLNAFPVNDNFQVSLQL